MKGAALDAVLAYVDQTLDASLARLFELLRIPSISTLPAHAPDVARAADWVALALTAMGFAAHVHPTAGHPIVTARRHDADAGAPHVLFYCHYDVQPPGVRAAWPSDPFEPVLRQADDGTTSIVARGVSDDKGQLMTFLEACRALIQTQGRLPINVTVLAEGEEESGSESLPLFLAQHAEQLRCDVALICDSEMWDRDTPAVMTRLRGFLAEEVRLTCQREELHSGLYGGPVVNPLHLLCSGLARLQDAQGRVTLPGFYDGAVPISEVDLASIAALPFDEAAQLQQLGQSSPRGEAGRGLLEQLWLHPAMDINGLHGGHTEEGFKTVLPASATAKVSFRLVPGQDPTAIRAAFRRFLCEQLPADVAVAFQSFGEATAWQWPEDSPWLAPVCTALQAEWGRPVAFTGSGASIPVVLELQRHLALHSLLVGFSLLDDAAHAPGEKYALRSFHQGIRSWVRILCELSVASEAARGSASERGLFP